MTTHTTPNPNSTPTPNRSADLVEATRPLVEAFEQTRAEREAIPLTALRPISLDVRRAATVARASVPDIEALLVEIAVKVPECDLALVRTIAVRADALQHAQTELQTAAAPDAELPKLNAEGEVLREQLRADLLAAARREIIGSDRLKELSNRSGYRNVATDLGILTHVARTEQAALAGKIAATPDELARAEKLAARMWHAIGEAERQPARIAAAELDRQRAFELLDTAYDAARRAIAYVRWEEDDADTIAPSLWRAAPRRRARPPEAKESAE